MSQFELPTCLLDFWFCDVDVMGFPIQCSRRCSPSVVGTRRHEQNKNPQQTMRWTSTTAVGITNTRPFRQV